MKRTIALLVALTIAGAAYGAEGDRLTAEQMPVLAAARIFALENNLRGDLGVADEDEAHIGQSFEVNRAQTTEGQIDECVFTMRKRGGPIVKQIDFSKLSAEYRTQRRGNYTLLQIPGKAGAVCEIESARIKGCRSGLEMLVMHYSPSTSELQLAMRALTYMAGYGPPAQLGF